VALHHSASDGEAGRAPPITNCPLIAFPTARAVSRVKINEFSDHPTLCRQGVAADRLIFRTNRALCVDSGGGRCWYTAGPDYAPTPAYWRTPWIPCLPAEHVGLTRSRFMSICRMAGKTPSGHARDGRLGIRAGSNGALLPNRRHPQFGQTAVSTGADGNPVVRNRASARAASRFDSPTKSGYGARL